MLAPNGTENELIKGIRQVNHEVVDLPDLDGDGYSKFQLGDGLPKER
jgi:hypothetical protein